MTSSPTGTAVSAEQAAAVDYEGLIERVEREAELGVCWSMPQALRAHLQEREG